MEQQLALDFSHCSVGPIFCRLGSCLFLSPCAPNLWGAEEWEGSWGIPRCENTVLGRPAGALEIVIGELCFLLCFGISPPVSCLDCLFMKVGIGLGILQIWRSPATVSCSLDLCSFIISPFSMEFFLSFFPPLNFSLPTYFSFFAVLIACLVQQMWGTDPTSIEVNSQIPIDFADSESEPLSREWGLELSRSK